MTDCDVIELRQLVHGYAAAIDACDVDAFLAVFAPHARLRSYHPGAEEPFADLAGHEQLASIPIGIHNIFRCTAHMMANPLFELDGDTATGSGLCTARHLSDDPAEPGALTVIIRFVDRYERLAGVWRIVDRQLRFLWSELHEVVEIDF